MTAADRTLVFAFLATPRNIEPPTGIEAPHETVFELVSLPGRFSVFGATHEEALREMQALIEHAMELAGSPLAWYDAELKRLTLAERALLENVVGRSAARGSMFRADNFVVALENEDMSEPVSAGCG